MLGIHVRNINTFLFMFTVTSSFLQRKEEDSQDKDRCVT